MSLWLGVCFGRTTAVNMSSSESRKVRPPASIFSTRRACRSSQRPGDRGSSSGDGIAYGSGGVAKHSSRHESHLTGGVSINPSGPQPVSTQDSAPHSQWNVVLEALTELRGEITKLKVDRRVPSNSPCVPQVSDVSPAHQPLRVNDGAGPSHGPPGAVSPASFSGFLEASSENDEACVPGQSDSTLHLSAKAFGPPETVSAEIDKSLADMVNFIFDNGLREEDYKSIYEDEIVKRPSNRPALAPVECNPQILDALRAESKKTDFRLKEVNKDIPRAATIITKSLLILDKVAQEENLPVVAHEVGMINGALALLGNVNFRNNLVRRYVMKREINQKLSHLCTDKVPMTRFLFDDDVSQSMKQMEESVKLKNAITSKKPPSTWRFPASRTRGFENSAAFRGFSRFQPYGFRKPAFKGAQRSSSALSNTLIKCQEPGQLQAPAVNEASEWFEGGRLHKFIHE